MGDKSPAPFILSGRVEKGTVMEKAIRKYFPIFALPTLLAFTIGFIVPFLYGIFLSFCEFTTVTDWSWVGLKNYTKIFVVNGTLDSSFLHSMWYTALFTVVSVCIINIMSFIIAMALTKGIKGTNLFRTVFFLPNLMRSIAITPDATALHVVPFVQLARSLGAADIV